MVEVHAYWNIISDCLFIQLMNYATDSYTILTPSYNLSWPSKLCLLDFDVAISLEGFSSQSLPKNVYAFVQIYLVHFGIPCLKWSQNISKVITENLLYLHSFYFFADFGRNCLAESLFFSTMIMAQTSTCIFFSVHSKTYFCRLTIQNE